MYRRRYSFVLSFAFQTSIHENIISKYTKIQSSIRRDLLRIGIARSVTVNVVKPPSLHASTLPPCSSHTRLTIASPMPLPSEECDSSA